MNGSLDWHEHRTYGSEPFRGVCGMQAGLRFDPEYEFVEYFKEDDRFRYVDLPGVIWMDDETVACNMCGEEISVYPYYGPKTRDYEPFNWKYDVRSSIDSSDWSFGFLHGSCFRELEADVKERVDAQQPHGIRWRAFMQLANKSIDEEAVMAADIELAQIMTRVRLIEESNKSN